MIFFGNRLIRGNRSKKVSTSSIIAFNSPNSGLLGEVGTSFKIHWNNIQSQGLFQEMSVFTDLCEDISTINIAPCINHKVIESILSNSKAVIISAYGMGNIPTNNTKFIDLLQQAIQNDVVIVIRT